MDGYNPAIPTVHPGTRLGPYELVSLAGIGGMGEVYKARDTRLDRIVAIKILPSALAADPVFKERFDREARAISALDHPHICALYDVGDQDGVSFLVMQCLEGETLADRLSKGPLPVDQAFAISIQVARALDCAHRAGIVHRDLKPGNIVLTKSGAKLLDFGLAKEAASPATAHANVTMTPTVSAPLTQQGALIGTFQYMAPEQIEGDAADARTDLFAFGAVLYEAVTGAKAFAGKSQASLIGAIMSSDPPPISSVQPIAPAALDRVVRKCLAKDRDARWQSACDLADELEWISTVPPETAAPTAAARSFRPWWASIAAAAAAALATTAVFSLRSSPPAQLMRFTITAPENTSFSNLALNANAFANSGVVSPDGTRIVFAAGDPKGKSQLWLRSFDSLSSRPLGDTQGAGFPFWSPDSHQVAFFSEGRLRRINVATGSVQSIASLGAPIRGGTWSRRGELLFGLQGSPDLFHVSEKGGEPRRVEGLAAASNDAMVTSWPSFLSDGRRFVYAAFSRTEDTEAVIYVADLDVPGATRLLSADSNAIFAEPHHLVFVRNGILTRQTLDPESGSLSQDPIPLAEGVTVDARQHLGAFSASATTLAYRTGDGAFTQFVRLDRQGNVLATLGPEGMYRNPIFDSTESRLLFSRANDGARWDAWFLTIPQGAMSRVTFNAGTEGAPVWWTDNKILYWHRTPGGGGIFAKTLTQQNEELVLDSPTPAYPYSVRSDGSSLLYVDAARGAFDIFTLPLGGDRKPKALVKTSFHEDGPQFSPDGGFFVYFSDETGRNEVYVQPFPPNGTRWPISTDGGIRPMWGLDGKELFFARLDGRLYSVPIRADQGSFHAGTPDYRFDLNATINGTRNSYVPTRDGGFLVNRTSNQVGAPINVVVNWQGEAR